MKHLDDIEAVKEVAYTPSSGIFLNNLYRASSMGKTENDAVTFIRSGSGLLDFFAQAGAMRGNKDKALDLFKKAFAENRQTAVRVLFYLRDVRGGQGERDLFRACLEWLGTTYPEVFDQIVAYVPEYGRWDDIFYDNDKCLEIIKTQLSSDKEAEKPSLLAKWMPSINASSKTTRAKGKFMQKKLGLSEVSYRKTLAKIRKKIKIVESSMSANEWKAINYSAVPSQASRIYKNAFKRHDTERYDKFIEKAEKGELKINAGTLYPYQIYKSVQSDYSKTLEALWNQLPDYTQGKNALVVADVSGSMIGDPIAVSVSLALYFAERNKGQFKDHFITFSGTPRLQRITGQTLMDKMSSIEGSEWEMNTNLQAVFDLILLTATMNHTPQAELPETIYIISDMEFDSACEDRTNFEVIKQNYSDHGYKIPNIVFWNVNAKSGKNIPVQKDESGVALVSGFSPIAFKIAVENKTPEEVMLDTVNSPRYEKIILN